MSNEWLTSMDGLPPEETECEVLISNEWQWCRIVHHSKCASWIVTKLDDRIIRNDLTKFRPIKSDREKTIEAAVDAMKDTPYYPESVKRLAAKLYDAGLLRLPEDK